MDRIFTWEAKYKIRKIMIHYQVNVLILLILAGTSLLSLSALECQADVHDKSSKSEKIEQAKKEWLADCEKRLGQNMVGKATPEETAEILQQVEETMPHDYSSEEWLQMRKKLLFFIDMANVHEECSVEDASKPYDGEEQKWYSKYFTPLKPLPDWPLMGGYARHFQDKQFEACAAAITRQLATDVAGLSEDDKRDMETLMSYLPQLQESGNFEWDAYDKVGVKDEERLYEAIYKFLEATSGPLSEKIVRPDRSKKFRDLFHDKMIFCSRIAAATQNSVDKYSRISDSYRFERFARRFKPETQKWIKAAKVCSQLRVYYKDANEWTLEEIKKAQPSRSSRIFHCLRPKKQAVE